MRPARPREVMVTIRRRVDFGLVGVMGLAAMGALLS